MEPQLTTTELRKSIKKFTIDTNFNNKLSNTGFIHIDLAPAAPVGEKAMQETIFEIHTRDNSHAPVQVKMVDMAKVTYKELSQVASCITFCSHALMAWDLCTFFWQRYLHLHSDTLFAIYFFQKI